MPVETAKSLDIPWIFAEISGIDLAVKLIFGRSSYPVMQEALHVNIDVLEIPVHVRTLASMYDPFY